MKRASLILALLSVGCASSEGIPTAILDGVVKICSLAALAAPSLRPMIAANRDAGTD
jgi:hypothetical protein